MSLWDNVKPFVFGGVSGMTATSVIQPLDTIKVRIQLLGEAGQKNISPFTVARNILNNEGAFSFYKGLDSALFRQATYGTARLGLYKSFFDHREAKVGKGNVGFLEKVALSWIAGALACLVGNPAD